MRKFLQACGVLGLFAWTVGGFVAWKAVGERVSFSAVQGDGPQAAERLSLLEERLGVLEADLRTLTGTLGTNFELLAARLDEAAAARTAGAAGQPGAPAVELAGALGDEGRAGPGAGDEPGTAPAPGEAPAAAAPKKSFLAFTLPSDEFAFDELQHYVLVAGLSRVGFDAKSTLHDFSGVSTEVSGELDADLSQPAGATGSVRVNAASLRTGLEDRDADMLEHLGAEEHPTIEFRLEAFEPGAVDVSAQKLQGRAKGHMTIRGVSREVTMPLRVHVDESRRVVIEGEMPVRLSDYGVPVPNQLGLISMEDEVEVWIALRARSAPAGN